MGRLLRLIIAFGVSILGLVIVMNMHQYHVNAQDTVPNQPSIVWVTGTQLMVQKRNSDNSLQAAQPYIIKGAAWSPTSICTPEQDRPAEFVKWYQQDIALMADMGINTVRTFYDFGTGVTATHILDEFYRHNIMVVMVVDRNIANIANITPTVNAYKNHPAILMWTIGNEWDLNNYYGQLPDQVASAAFTEQAAQIIHGLDTNHPASSILGDIIRRSFSAKDIVNTLVPSVDVWGINVYRGASFGGLFGQWQDISSKPMFVAEFGADSYDHRIAAENQIMQADFNEVLWREIHLHLSADRPDQPSLGGLVFEWNDEWWKNGSPCTHNITSEGNSGQPDGFNDEEWFGIVDLYRQPKRTYFQLQENFLSIESITETDLVTLSAYSEIYSQFFKDSVSFCYRYGLGEGGRGINVAVIDPDNGGIVNCRNFDTYMNRENFVNLSDYLSDDAAIPPGAIVLLAIADEGGFTDPAQADLITWECHTPRADARVETGYLALENLGSALIRDVGYWGSWGMISIKGQGSLIEAYHDPVYNPPVNGWCQMSGRVSTEISTTVTVTNVYPHKVRPPRILYVSPDGQDAEDCILFTSPCQSPQYAVRHTTEGDEIRIAEGVYSTVTSIDSPLGYLGTPEITQVMQISESLLIRGGYTRTNWHSSYPLTQPTVLDAGNQGRNVVITGYCTPTLENLQFTQGSAIGLGGAGITDDAGGGIYILGATTYLNNCLFTDNLAEYGGGLYLNNADLHTTNLLVANNHSLSYGSGLYVENSTLNMRHTTVARNDGGDLTGIYINGIGSRAYLTNTILSYQGAAIHVQSQNALTLSGVLWYSNTINYEGDGPVSVSQELYGDPDFISLISGDYSIGFESSAIDEGIVAGVPKDIDGDLRDDLAPDLGAYELQYDDSHTVVKSLQPDEMVFSLGPTLISMTLSSPETGTITATKVLTYPGGTQDDGEMRVVWHVFSDLSTAYPVTMSLCFSQADIDNISNLSDPINLRAFRWQDGIGWIKQPSQFVSTTNCVIATDINSFNAWTVADEEENGNGLPNAVQVYRYSGRIMSINLTLVSLLVLTFIYVLKGRRNVQ